MSVEWSKSPRNSCELTIEHSKIHVFICAFNPVASGSNPEHTFYALFIIFKNNENGKLKKETTIGLIQKTSLVYLGYTT